MIEDLKIRATERDSIIQSLRTGVVPRRGLQHIQVGRAREVNALLKDIDRISEDGSFIRFIIGEYGSGKTFFLNLIRSIVMEKRCVSIHADLSPDRRLHATGGQARLLYAELMKNLSTRSKPEGGALLAVVERFITETLKTAKSRDMSPETVIHENLAHLTEMVGGYDFAEVIAAYWKGHDSGDETLKSNALRWLRGEFSTKTDARSALGVRTIIDDANFYNMLKLMARFVRLAGFSGLVVCLDEMVNLYKLANTQARKSNYEEILHMLNDCLQGTAVGLGFLMGGTPDFLYDTRKGLYSYTALQTRLAQNTFAVNGLVDLTGPIIQLENLAAEDVFVLLTKLRHVFSSGDSSAYLLTDEGLHAFMEHCHTRIGDAYFRTPRNTIVSFINLLAILEQNPTVSWQDLLGKIEVEIDTTPDLEKMNPDGENNDDDLASFKL
ncbi:MAG TPA: ATP-binding protein [Candidatus Deferrimicrobium sp.]|nr:ATP-binding protein [Candidatus Deferrimicrobium sp.]